MYKDIFAIILLICFVFTAQVKADTTHSGTTTVQHGNVTIHHPNYIITPPKIVYSNWEARAEAAANRAAAANDGHAVVNKINLDSTRVINETIEATRRLHQSETNARAANIAAEAARRAAAAGEQSWQRSQRASQAATQANSALEAAKQSAINASRQAGSPLNVQGSSANSTRPSKKRENAHYGKYGFDAPNPHLWDTSAGLNTVVTNNPDEISGLTGVMGLTYMDYLRSREPQYYFRAAGTKFNTKKQINYYENLPSKIVAQFGSKPTLYPAGATQCVYSALQTIFFIYGGKDAVINGIPITDASFDDFAHDFVQSDERWVKALTSRHMGIEIKESYKNHLRVGDLVQEGNHRYWVGGLRIKNGKLQVLRVEASPRPMPKHDPYWKVRNAIKMNRWSDASNITSAVRLFDVASANATSPRSSIEDDHLHGKVKFATMHSPDFYTNTARQVSSTYTGNYLHQAAFITHSHSSQSDSIPEYERATFLAAGQLALAEYRFSHSVNLKGVPKAYITTIGALRILIPEYSYSYAETYIRWYYETFKHRNKGGLPPPVISVNKGVLTVEKQLAKLKSAIDALGYLRITVGDELFIDFTSRIIDKRLPRGNDTGYTDALYSLISKTYHVTTPQGGYRKGFYKLIDISYVLVASDVAINEFKAKHSLNTPFGGPMQDYTVGRLVLLPNRHARPYSDIYLLWLIKSRMINIPPPPVFGVEDIQSESSLNTAMEKLLSTLDLVSWLTSKNGEQGYVQLSKIVAASTQQTSYEAYAYSLASGVKKETGLPFPGWSHLQVRLDKVAEPGELFFEQHMGH